MNEMMIMNKEIRMTSLQVVEMINQFREMEKPKEEERRSSPMEHKSLMRKIRDELEALKLLNLVGEQNFAPVEYVDKKVELRPCYSLNRDGIIQISMSESVLVRYKMIEYINKLEEELQKYKLPQTYKEALIALVESVEKQEKLEAEKKLLLTDLTHKEDVIVGLVEDIDLATKRQRISQIIKYKFGGSDKVTRRWNLLYNEFEKKYHVDIKRRMNSTEAQNVKPKYKNKLDYIDRAMQMIPQLYELSCKLFENDIENLRREWESTITY
jgi:phage regulator Rha-like protein